ncbi:hypothetical protein [Neorhizobium alkalisoli]|uniref:RAD3-like DEAD/DEAH box helicase n=1 Tax=Neorhizobium alkalisoli TaxID=528178 RepID=A0A561Q0I0_9HYPH|nr:hypothetical protein [Neorhizobium alkalisoli]TWF43862.1 hypothetical protein FHW37_11814 [Neorhizobium alkalisoli]
MLSPDELLSELASNVTPSVIFECVSVIGARIAEFGRNDFIAQELTIRMVAALSEGRVPESVAAVVYQAVELAGLFPYISDTSPMHSIGQLVHDSHRVQPIRPFVFHSEQMAIFLALLDGDNVILSAPTSFGKSAIVDYFIMER